MPERLECEVLQKACYINTLTFTFYLYLMMHTHRTVLSQDVSLSVHLSVCPSVICVSIISKWLNIYLFFLQSGSYTFLIFFYTKHDNISTGTPTNGGIKFKGYENKNLSCRREAT